MIEPKTCPIPDRTAWYLQYIDKIKCAIYLSYDSSKTEKKGNQVAQEFKTSDKC